MEHPILFLDLLAGALSVHIPPHVLYTWFIMLLLLGLGFLELVWRRVTGWITE